MKRTPLSRAGFTLIELLIYTAILSLVAVGFISFALHISNIQVKHSARNIVEDGATFALDQVGRVIQESQGVVVAASTFGQDQSRVVLQTRDEVANPTVIEVGAGNVLQIQKGGNPSYAVTGEDTVVSRFVVNAFNTSTGRASLQVVLSLEKRDGADAFSRAATTVTTTFDIRD